MMAIGAILDFKLEWCKLFLIFQSPWYFWVSWHFSSGEEVQSRFSRSRTRRPSWILIGPTLAIFDLQVASIFSTMFRLAFLSGEEIQNIFSRGGVLDFGSNNFSNFFYLQDAMILPTKFRVSWPFGSGDVQTRFSRWWSWQPFWILHRNDFYYYYFFM